VQYAREVHTMLGLVGAGIGAALVPESACHLNPTGVVLRPIRTNTKAHSEFTLVWKKSSDNPALKVFVDSTLQKFVEQEGKLSPRTGCARRVVSPP
jgi:DNA-binding transcriptional LysR family regulator